MAERYTRLFSAKSDLYVSGSPVILSAGALLKDNQTGKVLAQLKIRSITENRIKAAKVSIASFDTVGHSLEGEAVHEYLDLNIIRDGEFGQKTLIPLPNASARSFSVTVTEVDFEDNSVWKNDAAFTEPLPAALSVSDWLKDAELVKQYGMRCGQTAARPERFSDLWRCACGAINHEAEERCHRCGSGIETLLACDLDELKAERDARLAEEKAAREEKEAAEKAAKEAAAKKTKKLLSIVLPAVAVCVAAFFLITKVIVPGNNYKKAVALREAGQYEEAIAAFEALGEYQDSGEQVEITKSERSYAEAEQALNDGKYDEAIRKFRILGDYKDSQKRIEEAQDGIYSPQYAEAESLLANGKAAEAAMLFAKLDGYRDSKERSFAIWRQAVPGSIAMGDAHSVALREDGTVLAIGYDKGGQCDVSKWAGITAIAAGSSHTVGLKSDGTVVAAGQNNYKQCEVYDWKDVKALSSCSAQTFGLRSDGTVLATGYNKDGRCDVSGWQDIIAISAGPWHTVGLKADGTAVAVGINTDGPCNVSSWKDIVAVSAGGWHTVGLRADGTVVAVGDNSYHQCDVSAWTDIVAVSAGPTHTIGLRSDGTIVVVGHNDYGACNITSSIWSKWNNIVAIETGYCNTIGIKADGTVVVTKSLGNSDYGQDKVSDWKNIKMPFAG